MSLSTVPSACSALPDQAAGRHPHQLKFPLNPKPPVLGHIFFIFFFFVFCFLKVVSAVMFESKSLTSCHFTPEYLFLQNKVIHFIITMSLSHLKLTVIPSHHVILSPYSHLPSCLEHVLLQLACFLSASNQGLHGTFDSPTPHLSPLASVSLAVLSVMALCSYVSFNLV